LQHFYAQLSWLGRQTNNFKNEAFVPLRVKNKRIVAAVAFMAPLVHVQDVLDLTNA
jgi:hypothetical protein